MFFDNVFLSLFCLNDTWNGHNISGLHFNCKFVDIFLSSTALKIVEEKTKHSMTSQTSLALRKLSFSSLNA